MTGRSHLSRLVPRLLFLAILPTLLALPFLPRNVSAEVVCDNEVVPRATPAVTPALAPDAAFPEDGGTLTILAAASLTDAFAEMEQRLEEAHPGLDIVIETAGSQTLVTQLEQGARADVLATADVRSMEGASASGFIAGDPVFFAANRLVVIVPVDNPAGVDSIDDLAGEDLSLILASGDVPAGSYAHRAFCRYARADDAPQGFIEAINGNLVSEEQDVRSVLTKILLGEADAGVVYASDAEAAKRSGQEVTVIEFPPGVSPAAVYPIAPVAGGNAESANAFIGYVLGEEGQQILADYGLSPVP
jgi:molybdate transport system substrate-binding protein